MTETLKPLSECKSWLADNPNGRWFYRKCTPEMAQSILAHIDALEKREQMAKHILTLIAKSGDGVSRQMASDTLRMMEEGK